MLHLLLTSRGWRSRCSWPRWPASQSRCSQHADFQQERRGPARASGTTRARLSPHLSLAEQRPPAPRSLESLRP
eukprot:767532-Hanusia_phi.AAC.2